MGAVVGERTAGCAGGALGEAATQWGGWGWGAKEVLGALAGDWAGGSGAERGDEGVGMGLAAVAMAGLGTAVVEEVAGRATAVTTLVHLQTRCIPQLSDRSGYIFRRSLRGRNRGQERGMYGRPIPGQVTTA